MRPAAQDLLVQRRAQSIRDSAIHKLNKKGPLKWTTENGQGKEYSKSCIKVFLPRNCFKINYNRIIQSIYFCHT